MAMPFKFAKEVLLMKNNDKLSSLAKFCELRREYDKFVYVAMTSIILDIENVRNTDIGAKRIVYVFVYENINTCSIYCNTVLTLDASKVLEHVVKKHHPTGTSSIPYTLSIDKIDRCFRIDIYEWIKRIYPRCSLTITKENCPAPHEEYGTVLIYRYVL